MKVHYIIGMLILAILASIAIICVSILYESLFGVECSLDVDGRRHGFVVTE